jgi:hypothetical protein
MTVCSACGFIEVVENAMLNNLEQVPCTDEKEIEEVKCTNAEVVELVSQKLKLDYEPSVQLKVNILTPSERKRLLTRLDKMKINRFELSNDLDLVVNSAITAHNKKNEQAKLRSKSLKSKSAKVDMA